MVNLSTSDWIAIAVGAVQLLASFAIAAWTIRRTAPAIGPVGTVPSKAKAGRFLWAWFKSSWLFLVFFVYAFYEVWSLSFGTAELSKSLVLRMILYAAYGVLNAIASVGFFVVQFQFETMSRLTDVLAQLNQVQGKSADMQRKHLAITERLLEREKPKRRRAK